MLEIRNLTVSYGPSRIVDEISLKLSPGDSLALIGETGTGKTTLALSIMGLGEMSCRGQIMFQGRDLLQLPPEDMVNVRWNSIAMVFQDVEGALNPLMTIIEQVSEPIISHGLLDKEQARQKAAGLLQKVGIRQEQFLFHPHQLSSGQKQRTLIAMALSNDPALLILDEPTASLDPLTKSEILKLLQEAGKNTALLVITHDLATAAVLCKNTAVLYAGRIVESGPTGDVLGVPRHPYTRGLTRSYPNMTTTKDLQGIPGQMSRPEQGCPFAPRCTQKIDRCRETAPDLVETRGRAVACHLGGIVPLLQVENLSKSFGPATVVNNLTTTLYEGETVALVGQSGSGKTTTARMIMGLLEPSAGTIALERQPVGDRKKDFYRRVQMIFQNPKESVSPRSSVLDAVMEPLRIHYPADMEANREKAIAVIQEVQLPVSEDFLQAFCYRLSSGEAQRVAIARALVLEPKLLIADEPTSALDPSVQAKIVKLLLDIQENRGISILFITHDLALARKISDRMIVLKEGTAVEEGPSHIVTAAPRHPYTRLLLEAAPVLLTGDSSLS